MIKQSLALAAMLAMAGCASESNPPTSQSQAQSSNVQLTEGHGQTQAELAAYAGSHQYPGSTPAKNDLKVAAIVVPDQGVIKIYNFGTQPIRDANIWVNQAYIRHVTSIAAGTSATIQMSNLYNGLGQQFSAQGEHVNLVQVEQDHDMQTLMGPLVQ